MGKFKAKTIIEPGDLSRLIGIANAVWQYVGHDFMIDCDDLDNEAAVECCFDADRPLLSTSSRTPEADNAFCKAMYEKYTFHAVVSQVAGQLNLV